VKGVLFFKEGAEIYQVDFRDSNTVLKKYWKQ